VTRPEGLLEVGRFGRPHGVRGHIYVKLSTDRHERVAPGARLWAGEWLEIESAQPMFNTGPDRWVVRITGVHDRSRAESLVNRVLFAEPIDDPEAVWVHEVIGARVVGVDGADHGVCVAVVANPANDLLELDNGMLVPVVFVRDVTRREDGGHICTVDVPAGLFEAQSDETTDDTGDGGGAH
jgi:16S rRNA processing protein RimM